MPSQKADAFRKTLAQLMKEERGRLGLSQEQLASRSGVDRATISRLESDDRVPSIMALYDLAEGLGTPLQVFIDRAHKQTPS